MFVENYENIDLKKIIEIIFSKKLFILLIILLSITIGYAYSYYYKVPKYKTSTTILLVADQKNNNQEVTQTDLNLNSNLISTYCNIAKSSKVLEKTIENLNLSMTQEELQKNITVEQVKQSQILKITVENNNPYTARDITNELSQVFIQEVANIYNLENVSIVDKAELELEPCNINHTKDMIIFTGIGIFLSIVFVMLIYIFDNTIKGEKDITNYTQLKTLGKVPLDKDNDNLIINNNPKSSIVESIKTIRTNILYTRNKKVILITSAKAKEGKSYIANNLSVTIAQTNKKVILVDANLRQKDSDENNIFNIPNGEGLSNFISDITEDKLANLNNAKKYIKETEIPNLHVLQKGSTPPNPSELLSSQKMKELLNILREMYDMVIIDGCASLEISDSIGLSTMVDSTILIVEDKKTKINELKKVKNNIENVNGRVAGVILNKVSTQQNKYYGKKYGYYYGNEEEQFEKTVKEENKTTLDEIIELAKAKMNQKEDIEEKDVNILEETTSTIENEAFAQKCLLEIQKLNNEIKKLKENQKNNIQVQQNLIKNLNYDEELSKLNSKIDNINYDEELSKLNNKIDNINYDEELSKLNNKIDNINYDEELNKLNSKIDNINYDEELSKLNSKIDNINYDEELSKLNSKIDNINYDKELNKLNSKIDNINYDKELSKLNNKIDNINYDEELSKLNNKIDNINYDEELSKLNNKIDEVIKNQDEKEEQQEEIKTPNNIISFDSFFKKKKSIKKEFSINEDINYEDLEKVSSYVIDFNENKIMEMAIGEK